MAFRATLDDVVGFVAPQLEEVEKGLRRHLDDISQTHTLQNRYSRFGDKAVGHLLKGHGKRLRPAMMLLSAHAASGGRSDRSNELVEAAIAVELIHSASLVHDDVIDDARFRRARVSANARFGNKIAVLAGDVLFTEFYSIVSNLASVEPLTRLRLLDLFTLVTKRMCFAEIYEEKIRNERKAVVFDNYLDIIRNKTASLMSSCCEAGAIISGADERTVGLLSEYGDEIGTAYQLYDDLADGDAVFGDRKRIRSEAERHSDNASAKLRSIAESGARDRLAMLVDLLRQMGGTAENGGQRS